MSSRHSSSVPAALPSGTAKTPQGGAAARHHGPAAVQRELRPPTGNGSSGKSRNARAQPSADGCLSRLMSASDVDKFAVRATLPFAQSAHSSRRAFLFQIPVMPNRCDGKRESSAVRSVSTARRDVNRGIHDDRSEVRKTTAKRETSCPTSTFTHSAMAKPTATPE